MKILDLIRYDPERGGFVLKSSNPPRVLDPWEELARVDRPSIFLRDPYFRAKNAGTIESTKGLDYKQFGTYTRAKERQPNKHEGVLTDAKTETAGAAKGKTSTRNRQTVGGTTTTRGN
jgi:hypothetical protein